MKPENPFLLSSLYCLNSRLHKWLFRRSTHNKHAASLARGSWPTGMASSAMVSPWRLCAISAFISFYLISFRTVEFVLSIKSCKLKWFRMRPAYASRLLNRLWLDESQTRIFSKENPAYWHSPSLRIHFHSNRLGLSSAWEHALASSYDKQMSLRWQTPNWNVVWHEFLRSDELY